MLDLIVSDAKLIAKVTVKIAIFGIVYTLTGLARLEATICTMKQKDGAIEIIPFDNKDKKNFGAAQTNFLKIVQDEK